MKKHWSHKYFGRKWSDLYDCYAFFCEIQRDVFGRKNVICTPETPRFSNKEEGIAYIRNSDDIKSKWHKVLLPEEGDAVIFGNESSSFHIGVCAKIDERFGVLHCQHNHGVVFTNFSAIKMCGAKIYTFLRYNND